MPIKVVSVMLYMLTEKVEASTVNQGGGAAFKDDTIERFMFAQD